MTRMAEVTAALGGLAYGGDYNPEQWPEARWREDVALMQQTGVNLVSVGIFSWALLEPERGEYEFDWLDRVLGMLHDGGIRVDLATATASTPPWFAAAYPRAQLVDDRGVRRSFGARQGYCPSSPQYRQAAAALAGRIAQRFADHPAVVMWHANNEYGCHNGQCFCEVSERAFRGWLTNRYGSIDALNQAWGTAFWSQRYADWSQIPAPRQPPDNSFMNPTQRLDWFRFADHEVLTCLRGEAAAVREHATQPLTTNFMGFFQPLNYREWVGEEDLVSNDHYLIAEDPEPLQHLAMGADLMRSLAGQEPWLLMEHSTSAVNWQPRNLAKMPGQMRRNSLQHIARGSDGALFFQWRASPAGAEKYHSGMIPHAGTDTRVWREVVELGANLRRLAEVAGTRVEAAQVGIVFDWPSWWAAGLEAHPSVDVDPLQVARRWHDACWRANIGVDFPSASEPLGHYRLLVVPAQYLMSDATADALCRYAEDGGRLVVTYFSGIVDEHDHVRLGGYPGALRDLLGVRIEEFYPLAAGTEVRLDAYGSGRIWSELGQGVGAEVLASYAAGPVAGSPAITRRATGQGQAWYVGTELDEAGFDALVGQLVESAGVRPALAALQSGVEAVRRVGPQHEYLFVINHTDAQVETGVGGVDLLAGSDRAPGEPVRVPAGGVAVIRTDRG